MNLIFYAKSPKTFSMRFFSLFLFSSLVVVGTTSSCKQEGCVGETPRHNATLYANYSNPTSGPELEVNEVISSEELNIGNTPIVSMLPEFRLELIYSGITFKEGNKVYTIDNEEVSSQRKAGECWITDDENSFSLSLSKSLDIVLVLDVSSSLEANITEIKTSAKSVISNILDSNSEASIAVIKFSRGSVVENFSSSETDLHQFIDANSIFTDPSTGSMYQIEGKSETALYESINEAIQLLNTSGADGRGILTFTDGVSNFQFDPQFQDEVEIIQAMESANVSHYTIGYVGNGNTIDRAILEELAINGNFSFPQDVSELQKVFITFSNSVAAVYDLRYETNNSPLESPIEYRLLFNTTVISE